MKKLLFLTLSIFSLAARPVVADQQPVSQLNELLRGELSAVETYRQALEKLHNEPDAAPLHTALSDHKDAVEKLSSKVKSMGGTPSTDSGAWGTWAETVVGSAKLLGDQAALKALKEGEQHGIKEYQEALANDNVSSDVKQMIRDTFIPMQQKHVAAIDTIMNDKKS